jgi:nitroreductase
VRGKVGRAPILVVVTQVGNPGDSVRDLEDYAACACATQNLLLAAHAEGLAGKWSTGKLAHSGGARRYLGLAEHDRIVAYVYLGYAATAVASEPRRRAPLTTWHGVARG